MSLPGVYQTTLKDGTLSYRASLTCRRKHISLGSFPDEETAHAAYLTASGLLTNPRMILPDYRDDSPLAFEKWVSLINLRDNGLYFSTPIYLMKTYFLYYLEPDLELKFDLDDLFYYASHKILRRGGHLFVADYGMQLTLGTRYGIKSYGIPGRDFLFVNQDNYDYRYENIHILNTYHGVLPVQKKGKRQYMARLHLRSYYIVGYYDTAMEAAIAYNKAIDVLGQNGITKNYVANYIDELAPSQYAELYNAVKISDKIYRLVHDL